MRIIDLPQDLQQTGDPRIRAIEDLDVVLRGLPQYIAHEDDDILVPVHEALNQQLLQVQLGAEDGSIAGQGQRANESTELLQELFDDVGLTA